MKIVVCDDDALVYEQMKNIIASYSIVKNENLELTFYQTVEELLHAKHKYDILFLDIRFNNCDIGIDVAKKLRKAGNTSLIILLTSLHSKAIEGYEIGAYRYIVKPIIKEKMYAVLDEAISSIRSNYRVILVKDMYNTVVVKIQQILYIYPSSEYSFFNTVLEEDDKSKTMIFVSHRLKIASKMNRIIYLENGKIVGIGTHQQLMTGCEKYRRYYVSWLLMEND